MKTTLQTYAQKTIGKNIDTDWVFWSQCVDQAKHYAKEVLWITLWSFWGSAKDGWANKVNTFPASEWERIPNNPKDKNQIPQVWDIIFWTGGKYQKYWHVGVVYEVFKGENKLLILNQNTGSGDGRWKDDAVRIQEYTYANIAGWYRLKKSSYRNIAWESVIKDMRKVSELLGVSEEKADEIVALMEIIADRRK